MTSAKILHFDIETSPLIGYAWRRYDTTLIKIIEDWYILCWAAKWDDGKKVMSSALPDFSHYAKNPKDDYHVVQALWELVDEADVVVAHNGNGFDIKKLNSRFLYHDMPLPRPFKSVDTLQIARRHFGFSDNRLDSLGEHLGVGRKIKTDFSLWEGCLDGDPASWKKMVKYNKQDVLLLKKIYDRIKPYAPRHPNLAVFNEKEQVVCGTCGSNKVHKDGLYRTNSAVYQAYECQGCGAWFRDRQQLHVKNKDPRKTIVCDRR